MKIKQEFKLNDFKKCWGCPCMDEYEGDYNCNLDYEGLDLFNPEQRPQKCIEENGE